MSGDHASGHEHEEEGSLLSDVALRVRAIESLLIEKGLVDAEALDEIVQNFEHKVGPHHGARVVARAWCDVRFKERLLDNAEAAIAESDLVSPLGSSLAGGNLVVVENTSTVHNLVVCTLCSCYPIAMLGLPPVWYKSAPYRSRAVIDPRGVLLEFGVEVGDEVEVHVWDSNSEMRYLVLPERPAGTEGWTETQLAARVTRDSMIGVARVTAA